MTKIVFLDKLGIADHIPIKPLDRTFDQYDWINYATTAPNQVQQRIEGATIVIVSKVVLDRKLLENCATIKHIAVAATGFNNVDISACRDLGISVSNIQSYANSSVPEHVLSIAFALRRRLLSYRQHVLAGRWSRSPVFCLFEEPIKDLKDCTFGVVGYGELGRATAELANAVGMRVIYHSRTRVSNTNHHYVELEELLSTSDIISLHCTLNESSKDLISDREFTIMKNSAVLINTARGGIVNEQAAINAITNKQIAALGFDVLCDEPPQRSHPLLDIADLDNVIITPHIAWASDSAMQTLTDQLVNNIQAFLAGKPQNLVCG